MAETVESKIKILRQTLKREQKNEANFSLLDKTLTENESYIRMQLANIEQNLQTLTKIDREIVASADDNDEVFQAYDKDCVFEKLKELLFIQAMKYNDQLKLVNTTFDQTQASANSTTVAQNNSDPFSYYGIKLPTMTIDPFDGTFTSWHSFRDKFERAIHNNRNLCNSTKLEYLDSLLKGEAKKVIKRGTFQLKPENNDTLWEMLKKRYEHKRSLANAYFQELFNQETIAKETSKSLRNLHDTTYDVLSSLQNMGLEPDNWGDVLVFLLTSKLPLHTRELWEEKIGETDELPEFKVFMNFLENRFRTLEGIESTRSKTGEVSKRFIPQRKTIHFILKQILKRVAHKSASVATKTHIICTSVRNSKH